MKSTSTKRKKCLMLLISPIHTCDSNATQPRFRSDLWWWHHYSQLDCDSGVQTAYEIFGKSHLLRQSSSIFGCARRIFAPYKHVKCLCRLVVWMNQWLQMQVRHSYHSGVHTAFEIFGESHLLWQSSSIFGCARRIFASYKHVKCLCRLIV